MALIQLSKRTGSDPVPDYEQLVREDRLNGRVNGERFRDFLPVNLISMIPDNSEMTDKGVIAYLKEKLGEKCLIKYLVDNFFKLGKAGENHAAISWQTLGLDTFRRAEIGHALQALLLVIDQVVEELGIEELQGFIRISNRQVSFAMQEPDIINSIDGYHVEVT